MEGTNYDIEERLAFHVEWYVLDDNRGGYNLVVQAGRSGGDRGSEDMTHGRRASRGGEIRVIIRGQGTVVSHGRCIIIEPLLL